ncbi:alpha/beta fold hydrolase [Kibdelosporangium philippinense]|uniref:alpha/beta fold hydrolase n=1 Tax=Kibdelosporangium philippinense TaxID=211113 RepID=UPI00360B3D3E
MACFALAASLATSVALPVSAAQEASLTWSDCGDGFECSSVSVPVDYDNPSGSRIDLAVIKLPAGDSAKRIGTLFVNFGGPGASGLQRLRERAKWPWLFSDELRSRFDIVSWDPRGIANSAAVRCFDTLAEQQEFFAEFPEMPVDLAGEAPFYEKSKELAYRCEQQAGPVLKHVSTANTARDLDMLRRAVGEEKISYHGISYGTHLGAIYANLFPNRIRAMVFDGSMAFAGNAVGRGDSGFKVPLDTRQDVSRGVAETHEQFLKLCAESGPKCAFSGGDLKAKYAAIAERAKLGPITIEGDEGPETWTWSGISNMAWDYASVSAWPDLAKLYQRLYDARDTAARKSGEPYTSNRSEAFNAIQCSDSNFPTDTAIYSTYAMSEDQRIPYFGRLSVFDMMSCAFWSAKDTDRYTGPWNRRTSAEILVLNNRYDPSTPLHGAIDGAKDLARARIFVTEGYGHSTMLAPSTCTEQVKREYLIAGKFPAAGKVCKLDANPFG